ncbi:hypothetical protein PInf_005538 [Phytophthora infestans]|nr:hypothetical protein PInf_005538 [Phytophthora infestans]
MGACASRDANRSPRRLSKWKVDEETPTVVDGTASTPSRADDQAAAAATPSRGEPEIDLVLNCVAFSSFLGNDCLTGWEDGSIQRLNWHTTASAPVNVWKPHTRAVNRIVIGDKLQMIFSCSRDTTVAITPITDKPASETATVLRGHQLNVSTVAVDDAEQTLCSGGRDTQTIFWDLTTSHITAKNTTPQNVVTCSTWLPGEALVAQGSEDLSVKFWDPRTPLRVPAQSLRGFVYFPLSIAAYGENDNTYLLTSSKGFNGVGCEARVWDRRTGKQVIEFQGHQQDATACCFLPSAADKSEKTGPLPMIPVTASKDGTVKVWDAATLSPLAEAHADGAKRMFTSLCKVDTTECGQQLRSSKFDFEVLLGASVASVWQALGRHVARQLSLRKGVSLHQLGKFGFYKTQTSMLSAQPVFLLSDRLTSTYGFVWRHCSSPAPLTATAEVSMAALGNEAGLGSDQTRRTLDAIVAFVGQRLQGGGRQILPRFLMPESRVPPDMLKTRPAHDQVMQAAYQREVASIRQAKCVDVQFNKLLAHRQRVVHIQDLQKRAEESVAQKELNAFLSSQIEVKRHRSRLKSASADHRAIKILPLERVMGDEMKRSEKKKLNQRLNEQVAAKAALKKDKRTLDQAETAYFISKLKIQDDIDRHEVAERKRIEKATLLAGWSQQKALRAQKSARG